jgi:hypothetical protein
MSDIYLIILSTRLEGFYVLRKFYDLLNLVLPSISLYENRYKMDETPFNQNEVVSNEFIAPVVNSLLGWMPIFLILAR